MAKRTTAAKKTSSTKPSVKKKAASPKKKTAKKATARTTKASTSRTKKASAAKKGASNKVASDKSVSDEEVTIDRRETTPERREEEAKSETPKLERRKKVNRRRQIDPTTCERDYSDDEVEFMNALNEYKRTSGRMFPTCSEVLEVIRSLGYAKLSSVELAARNADANSDSLEEDVVDALAAAQEASDEVNLGSFAEEQAEEEAFIG